MQSSEHPTPDDDSSRPRKRAYRGRKRYGIECYHKEWVRGYIDRNGVRSEKVTPAHWDTYWHWYETADQRDEALATVRKKNDVPWVLEYRAVER